MSEGLSKGPIEDLPKNSRLLEKCMIVSILTTVFCIALWLGFYNDHTNDAIAWITLSISTGIGIMIALIVDDRATKSYDEVMKSQKQINRLLDQLDKTDKKHEETLGLLDKGRIENESAALLTIIKKCSYINEILGTIIPVLDSRSTRPEQKKELIGKTVSHIESPLNIIEDAIQNVGNRLTEIQRNTLLSLTSILRKNIILSSLNVDSTTENLLGNLKSVKTKLDGLLQAINQN